MHDHERLDRFTREVLSGGPTACLPSALSARWLDVLGAQGDLYRDAEHDGSVAELVGAVLVLVGHRQGGGTRVVLSEIELHEALERYVLELALESMTRRTGTTVEAATLETILTDRDVQVSLDDALVSAHERAQQP